MAGDEKKSKNEKVRKDNAIVRYIRDTSTELKKVRWPSRKDTWMLTRIVLVVTFGMAIFLGALDWVFVWLLRGVVSQSILFYVLAAVLAGGIAAAAILIGRGEEV
ncbi:MAG: preprotein translocase subunit SecE [Anaerolineae bacterium]|nr:preprotein translocase subunit SecE [Anaerolineae bacterium]